MGDPGRRSKIPAARAQRQDHQHLVDRRTRWIRDARRLLRLQNFAARALTRSVAKEYASAGITVNAHCPGVVGTDMWVTIDERFSEVTGAPKGQTYQQFVGGIAFGRAQTSADGRRLRVYLAGPDSDYMTGQAGLIDGGLVCR